jgi:hypothetical protein
LYMYIYIYIWCHTAPSKDWSSGFTHLGCMDESVQAWYVLSKMPEHHWGTDSFQHAAVCARAYVSMCGNVWYMHECRT